MPALIRLVANSTLTTLPMAMRDHLEGSLRSVIGASVQTIQEWESILQDDSGEDAVFCFPILIPSCQQQIPALLRTLKRHQPFATLFGVLFVLLPEEELFSPDAFFERFWLDVMDEFSDQAVPVSFVCWYREIPQVQRFQLAASAAGLIRELENLRELRRIGDVLADLENRVGQLEECGSAL